MKNIGLGPVAEAYGYVVNSDHIKVQTVCPPLLGSD